MKIFKLKRRVPWWGSVLLGLTAAILVACGNGIPTPTATSVAPTLGAVPTATPPSAVTPQPVVTPQPEATATLSPTATTAAEPTATPAPTPTSQPTATQTPTPTPTSVPAATAAPAATATPTPTSTPTPEPSPTALPEPTAIPVQFTSVVEFGFSLRLDGNVDVQSAGWTEAEPTAEHGRVSFAAGGVNAILIWSPVGDQTPLNFLADTALHKKSCLHKKSDFCTKSHDPAPPRQATRGWRLSALASDT